MFNNRWVSLIVPAAGIGTRMQSPEKKQFMLIEGQPVIYWTLKGLLSDSVIDELIVVVGKTEINRMTTYLSTWLKDIGRRVNYRVIEGGATRQASVFCGLKALSPQTAYVAIHDAVRPFVKGEWIGQMIERMVDESYAGATVGQRIHDTIKKVNAEAMIEENVDRACLMSVQTPQVFDYQSLFKAHQVAEQSGEIATDDTHLLGLIGLGVKIIEKGQNNIKITTPAEWQLAQMLMPLWLETIKNEKN